MSLTSLADNKMHQILQAEYMRTIYASQEFIPGAKKYTGGCSSCGRSGHTRINKDCPNQQKLRLKDLLLDSSKCDRKHYVFLNNLPTGHDSAEDNQARPIFKEASAATAPEVLAPTGIPATTAPTAEPNGTIPLLSCLLSFLHAKK